MKFSVFDYKQQAYRVYDDGKGHASTHAGSPPKALFKSALGATAEQAAWSVPPGSKFVGMSALPQGRIATEGGSLAGIGLGDITASDTGKIAIAAVIAYVAYRSSKK